MQRGWIDARDGALGADHRHPKRLAKASNLRADLADAEDPECAPFEVGTGVALPMLAPLVIQHAPQPFGEHEYRHHAELGQRLGVDAARGREDRVRHTAVVAHALDELADSGASRLNPAD